MKSIYPFRYATVTQRAIGEPIGATESKSAFLACAERELQQDSEGVIQSLEGGQDGQTK